VALIPPHYLKSVVALGSVTDEGDRVWIASGFHFFYRRPDSTDAEPRYLPFLVTNRHVVEHTDSLFVRVNPLATGAAREYEIGASTSNWTGHPDPGIDVAVIPVNADLIHQEALDVYFLQSDTDCATVERMNHEGVREGDLVYVLGFPMGLVGAERDPVIALRGSIARIRDLLEGSVGSFIVDSTVFPGNSGGPVILRPETSSVTGTPAVATAYAIGVVAAYLHYPDVAVSQQTGRPRVVFEENAGLAQVFPIDAVLATVEHVLQSASTTQETREERQPPETGVTVE
jgi:hypothetical protein